MSDAPAPRSGSRSGPLLLTAAGLLICYLSGYIACRWSLVLIHRSGSSHWIQANLTAAEGETVTMDHPWHGEDPDGGGRIRERRWLDALFLPLRFAEEQYHRRKR